MGLAGLLVGLVLVVAVLSVIAVVLKGLFWVLDTPFRISRDRRFMAEYREHRAMVAEADRRLAEEKARERMASQLTS
jgi:hypothetical protein